MGRSLFTVVILGAALFASFWAGQRCSPDEEPEVPQTTVVEKSSPPVVVSMRALARLEGAEFHMERIIDLREKQSRFRGLIEAEDALLLVAAGDVIAGVDLSGLIESDVELGESGKVARVKLPAAEVFSARLDSERTYVHSRETDVLAKRAENLETKARARAESTLRDAAIEAGLLSKAEDSVERSVTALLLSLGFNRVEVTFERARNMGGK